MNATPLMRADDLAAAFNGSTEHRYWRASVAGARLAPEVHFNSRSSMVRVTYRVDTNDFTITFSKANAAFGDFMASSYKALYQVLASLVSAGLPFDLPDEATAVLRLEYNPATKAVTVHIDHCGARWITLDPLAFKTPERKTAESSLSAIDL